MRILLDTDPGIDDALAVLFLSAQPQVEITAVGSVHGNVAASQAADNALNVLAIADLSDVPVAVGANRPLAQPLHTAEFVHGHDGLGGLATAPTPARPVDISAAEQLVTLARQHPGEFTLLALGPLTNLALALLLEPEFPRLVHKVVVMGGAVEAPGNLTSQADANTGHDPEAADLVYTAGFDLTFVGLDVTEAARADTTWLDALARRENHRARFATDLLQYYRKVYSGLFGDDVVTLHDPLAAAIALDPTLATYRDLAINVELRGSHTRGRTVADLRPYRIDSDTEPRTPVHVAHTVDTDSFLQRLLQSL